MRFIARVRQEVPARLVQASLFGSKARGEARPDSDIDILLVFERLPPDREPHATIAEEVAAEVARASGIPVTTWSVSLVDLRRGQRTPMLVDALEDSVPLWWDAHPLRPVAFTPQDALWCTEALLTRVSEGSDEFAWHLSRDDGGEAARRARDDVVRLCTAGLLLRGITRPRRGEAVQAFRRRVLDGAPIPRDLLRVLAWAAASFGPHGRDDEGPVGPPPGGARAVAAAIDRLRREVVLRAHDLDDRLERGGTWAAIQDTAF